ncbi:MAG: hypothetical protein JXA24_07955 [Proteobacteria bacterium]|nr:hypothetical protein [Pseudomonadota bacterium]
MFPRYLSSVWLIGLVLALIIPMAGCHSGEVVSEDEGGGDGTEITLAAEFATSASARNGVTLEFSEPMDAASVEGNLYIVQGDFSASAGISKAVDDGDEIDVKSYIWAPDHKSVSVKWPARYSHAYTLILDAGAKSEAGTNIAERIVAVARVGLNQLNFDGDEGDTADIHVYDGFVTDGMGNPLPTLLVLSQQEILRLITNPANMMVNLREINLKEEGLWHYSSELLDIQKIFRMLGRLDDGSAIVGARVDGYLNLFSHDASDPLTIIGSDLPKVIGFQTAGDLNADGYQDLAIQAAIDDTTAVSALILGNATFFSDLGEKPATDENLYAVSARMEAGAVGNCSKSVTIGVGDLDGDGFGDVSACYQMGVENEITQTVIRYFGADAASLPGDPLAGPAITNVPAKTGLSLTGVIAADLNGDTIDDLITPYLEVAGSSKAPASTESGALIFFGKKGVRSDMAVPADVDVDIKLGTATELKAENLGYIDEDGFEDVILLIQDYDPIVGKQTSRIVGISGRAQWDAAIDAQGLAVDCAEALTGASCEDITSLGDVDNDGYDDTGVWLSVTDLGTVYYLAILGGGPGASVDEISAGSTGGFKMLGNIVYDATK